MPDRAGTNVYEVGQTQSLPHLRGYLADTVPIWTLMMASDGLSTTTTVDPVSYTHLDVYKRQTYPKICIS